MGKLELIKANINVGLLRRREKRRAILGLFLGTMALGISCLIFAKVEPVIALTGQLKTGEAVTRLQLPKDSVINEIYVKPGEQVEKGQRILNFELKNYSRKLKNLETFAKLLKEENQLYLMVINESPDRAEVEKAWGTELVTDMARLKLSAEKKALVKNRINLIKEQRRLIAQINQNKEQLANKIKQLEILNNKSYAQLSTSEFNQELIKQKQGNKNIIREIKNQQQAIIIQQKRLIKKEDKLTEINQKLNSFIADNKAQVHELDKQIQQYKNNLKSNYYFAPISGKLDEDNLNNQKSFQINSEQNFIAEVFLPSEYSQLLEKNTKVEVKIDALEKTKTFTGTIVDIGSDLLPPSEIYPFYRLPASISFAELNLTKDEQATVLKSNKAVSVKLQIPHKLPLWEIIYKNLQSNIYNY